ncbi:3-keto-5-aminohexanoate cleavage protein [Mesorhizobium yinganensis]|uniref:3-keto-5-aminohexanoate cleavage protein n=1 Tax=Mesorhizobium yinganensis TaxID=3157707 RepID=UPI0032B75D7E
MIVQACINGARSASFHPGLPLTAEAMARDAAACVLAGAAELHIHPREPGERESLAAIDATIPLVRKACPGTLVGVSTGAWIEDDEARTRALIDGWRELPDYASVNLSEPDAPAVMERLRARGVGIEAGLASVADAERLIGLDSGGRLFRVLIEISEQDFAEASEVAHGIHAVLQRACLRKPILLHGQDATVWPFVERAAERHWSTRVGLEDGSYLPDGSIASGNAALVAAAVEVFRSRRQ